MQRALKLSESTGPATQKPQHLANNVPQPPSELKEKPAALKGPQKDQDKVTPKKEPLDAKVPVSASIQKDVIAQPGAESKTPMVSDAKQGPGARVAGQQQQVQKPDLKPAAPKQEPSKVPQEPKKPVTQPPKSPSTSQPPKQESGSFFGFGAPKTQPVAAKSSESVTGKMFGFGSSFLSSASTMISSAVQDEPRVTPPTPRKMSTTAPVSPKAMSPVMPAKGTKPPDTAKSKPPQGTELPQPTLEKVASPEVKRTSPEPQKSTKEVKAPPKDELSTCPLCKAELNIGSKDPPNYNTCTNCKNIVCNLCGFNPMPHTGAVSANIQLYHHFI